MPAIKPEDSLHNLNSKSERRGGYNDEFSRTLLTHSPIPILVANSDSSIRYVNPAMERLSGYTSSELIGVKVPYPWWQQESIQKYATVADLLAHNVFNEERRYHKKNGDILWIVLNVRKILEEGRLKYSISTWVDVTERKKVEEQIRLDEARLEGLLQISQNQGKNVKELFEIALEEAIHLTGSQIGYAYYYLDREELVLSNWFKAVHSGLNSQMIQPPDSGGFMGEALRQRQPLILNDFKASSFLKRPLPSGHTNISNYMAVPILADERVVAMVGVANKAADYDSADLRQLTLLMDMVWKIVKQRKSEEALKLAADKMKDLYNTEKNQREELQEEAKARSMFIDVLAHELRTPLTPILSSTDMLRVIIDTGKDDVQKRLIANILVSSQTLAKRLDELLDFARHSRGAIKLNLERIDLAQFITSVASRFEPTISQRDQKITLDIHEGLPEAEADPSRLEQVLINLLSNASKFSPRKGNIILRVQSGEHGLLVEVADEGVGISEEDQDHLFQPYHRVEQDRRKFPGMGLGLAVSKQIVEAHGGKIWVTSRRGQGSTFSFCIPFNIDSNAQSKIL